jgi:hypothetical protein
MPPRGKIGCPKSRKVYKEEGHSTKNKSQAKVIYFFHRINVLIAFVAMANSSTDEGEKRKRKKKY